MNNIKNKIKQFRKLHNLTQSEFATNVGLTQATISNFEEGKREPSVTALSKISNFLGVTIDYLVNDNISYNNENAIIELLIVKLKRLNNNELIALNLYLEERLKT